MPAFILGGSVWHIFPVKNEKKITKQRKVSPLTWWQYQLALGSTELQQGEGLLPKYTEKQWPTETNIDLSPYQYKIPPEIHSILTLSKDRIRFFFSYFQSGPRSTNKTRGNSVSHPWFFFFEAKFQPWTTLIACSMQTKPYLHWVSVSIKSYGGSWKAAPCEVKHLLCLCEDWVSDLSTHVNVGWTW